MREIKKIIIFTLIAAIAACPLYTYGAGEDETSLSTIKQSGQLSLTGVVKFNRLETGYYEVDGYRLEGEYDFSKFEGKTVVVKGEISNSMSIFMTRAIKVNSIKLIDEAENSDEPEKELEQTMNEIKKIEDSIKQNGEASSEAEQYKEELRELQKDVVRILEEHIKSDGSSIDLAKYEKMGKVLKTIESKSISVYIDGVKMNFEKEAVPFIDNGRTLVPFRAVAEGLAAEVSWNGEAKRVIVEKDGKVIELTIGDTRANVNGNFVELDVPAKIVNGRTVIPLRFIGESLDADVDWVSEGQIVVIGSKGKSKFYNTDFSVGYNGSSIKLGDWDNKVNIKGIFGEPLSEKIDQLGSGADTFTGSYVKEIKYDGLVFRLMSPKDNGKSFFIDKIEISKGDFITARDIKVGDSYSKIIEKYKYVPLWETTYDEKNHEYILKDDGYNYIKFDVKQGVIKSISIYTEHP